MRWSIVPVVDGVHDMGGMQGFGPVTWPGADAPFHEEWEARILAMTVITGFERLRCNNGRADREEMEPAEYLAAGYFDRWVYSTERGLVENGMVTTAEVDAMVERLRAGEEPARTSNPAQVEKILHDLTDVPTLPPADNPQFAVGDRVRVRRMRPEGHNRCPRYVRGIEGVVERVQCSDTRPGAGAEPVYLVGFASADLWGPDADPGSVAMDLWEGYLEPAP
jgi:nitrile hydratase subunit beta